MYVGVQGRLIRPQPIDYGVVQGLTAALSGRYAGLRSVVIGHSVLGREISALVLGDGAQAQVLMAAAIRGQDWFTSLCALRLCEEMCSHLRADLSLCDIPLSRAMQGRQVWFVPLVNPDGVEIARYGSGAAGTFAAMAARCGGDTPGMWQGNARGVDIHSNFTPGRAEMQALAQKRDKNPTDEPRQGEPETVALMNLCHRVPFRHVVALHTQGECIHCPCGASPPPQSRMMAKILSAVSGYRMVQEYPIGARSGIAGWFADAFRRPGFTLDLGRGPCPLPLREFESLYRQVREMLLVSVLL